MAETRLPIEVLREIPPATPKGFCSTCGEPIQWSPIVHGWKHQAGMVIPPWARHQPELDVNRLPTSVLINLYTVAVDGVVTEMHKAMQARSETVRRTGFRRAMRCICDGGAFEVKARPFIVNRECDIHGDHSRTQAQATQVDGAVEPK